MIFNMEEDYMKNSVKEVGLTSVINTVIVVRHAESMANSKGIYQGQTYNTDLSELGKRQAEALAERLKNSGIKKIIASPLKRTFQTANKVAEITGCKIEVNEMIIETNHGTWEGKHKEMIKENYPDIFKLWLQKPYETVFPGGEAFSETVRRTLEFLENTDFDKRTLVVTHDNIVRVMISLISNFDINKMWNMQLETASLNFFEVNKVNQKNLFRTLKLNDVEHLKGLRNNITNHAL